MEIKMNIKDIEAFICNGFDNTKEVIMGVFGKSADAFNDYDVVVNVTEHGKGPDQEPTGSRAYHRKYRINLGNLVLVVLGVVAAIAVAVGIYSLVDNGKD